MLHVDTDRLRALAPDPTAPPPACKICSARTTLFDVVDFNKFCSGDFPYRHGLCGIPVYYFKCENCGFLFTTFTESWQATDYADHIYNREYVLIDPDYIRDRPEQMARVFASQFMFSASIPILDYGSGGGVFSQALRRLGFAHVDEYDPFSRPERPQGRFGVVFASEVIEHSNEPIATLEDMLSFCDPEGVIVLTTALVPEDIDRLRGAWWYIGPRNGHVSAFSQAAMARAVERFGMKEYLAPFLPVFSRSPEHVALHRFGDRSTTTHRLAAPAGADEAWHAVEQIAHFRARWTARPVVGWSVPGPNCRGELILEIPVVLDAGEDLAARQVVRVNGVEVATELVGGGHERRIRARLMADPVEVLQVEMQTPHTIGPERRGAGDIRELSVMVEIVNPSDRA